MLKLRVLAVKHQTALLNQLIALLAEFNIHSSSRNGGIRSAVGNLLEDADNGFTCECRDVIRVAALGCGNMGLFKKGKDASACIGLTPKQYSSGGVIKLGAIGNRVKHGKLRSQLIVGTMAVVGHIDKRVAKTKKEFWLKKLIERKGKKCAAVALANKTVRTAFAIITQGTGYKTEL